MTREPNTDQIVTRWVDEGPEVAPERFVWAALDQVERTPQRGRWRVTLENTPMLLKFAVPVLGAAAAIVLGIVDLWKPESRASRRAKRHSGAEPVGCGQRRSHARSV